MSSDSSDVDYDIEIPAAAVVRGGPRGRQANRKAAGNPPAPKSKGKPLAPANDMDEDASSERPRRANGNAKKRLSDPAWDDDSQSDSDDGVGARGGRGRNTRNKDVVPDSGIMDSYFMCGFGMYYKV
jgi:hypothetical protein